MNDPLGLQRGTVRLEDYNPKWKQIFKEEQSLLKEALGNKFIAVEHVGSTAIPGIKAKPIMDIMLAIADLDDWKLIQEPLASLGYKFRKDFRNEQQHILFVKGPEENRTHYLKVTELNSKFWTENILFRDFLINNPKYRDEYEKIKEQLFKTHQDNRELYTKGKEEFIHKILGLAGSKDEIQQMLSGGDMRSIGKADEVAAMVLADTTLFAELFACLTLDNPPVRMRAADALEKVTQKKPELLQKYKKQILDEIAYIDQQEVQWHVAQMVPRLELAPSEVIKATNILDNYLNNTSSNIVCVMSLQAFADLALQGKLPREQAVHKIESYTQKIQTPSIKARSKKLLQELSRMK